MKLKDKVVVVTGSTRGIGQRNTSWGTSPFMTSAFTILCSSVIISTQAGDYICRQQ